MSLPHRWLHTLDPDQLKALDLLQSQPHLLLSVNEQEKQLELITAWAIEQALAGKKAYLVIGSPEQRNQLHRRFQDLDLSAIVYLKNEAGYYPAIQLARKRLPDEKEVKSQQFAMSAASQEMKQWQEKYEVLQTRVFDTMTWQDIADRLAAHPLSGNPNILSLKLNPTEFERTAEEYKMIRSKLSNYVKLCKLNHPWFDQLQELNISHLKKYALETIKKEVTAHLSQNTETGERLIREGEILLLDYIQHSKQSLQAILKKSYHEISTLLFKIENYQQFLGPEFSMETSLGNFTLKLKSNFTRASKDLIKARRWVKSAYINLLTNLEILEAYLPVESLQPAETLSMDAITAHLNRLSRELQDCERKMQARINEQIKRLNSKNLPSGHPLQGRIGEWEKQLFEWKRQIDESEFLDLGKEVNALSVRKKLGIVTEIVRQLREMRRACAKLEDFFFWRSFEDNIPENARKVIAALEFEEHHKWLDLFDQWYFMSTLDQHTLAEMPDSGSYLEVPEQIASSGLKAIVQYLKLETQSQRYAFLHSGAQDARSVMKLIRKKDESGTIQAIEFLEPDQRMQLFPIQIIGPELFTRKYGTDYTNPEAAVLYVLDEAHIEVGNQLASTTRKGTCHIISSPGVAHRLLQTSQSTRKVQFTFMRIQSADLSDSAYTLANVSSSEKLNFYKRVASMLEPVYENMTIYNTKFVQVISFLGPKLDAWLLDELPFPYKIHEEGMNPTSAFLVECLLDQKKPLLILVRDGLFSPGAHGSVRWQNMVMKRCAEVGFPIHNSWTVDWMNHGGRQMGGVKSFILKHVPDYISQEHMKSA